MGFDKTSAAADEIPRLSCVAGVHFVSSVSGTPKCVTRLLPIPISDAASSSILNTRRSGTNSTILSIRSENLKEPIGPARSSSSVCRVPLVLRWCLCRLSSQSGSFRIDAEKVSWCLLESSSCNSWTAAGVQRYGGTFEYGSGIPPLTPAEARIRLDMPSSACRWINAEVSLLTSLASSTDPVRLKEISAALSLSTS